MFKLEILIADDDDHSISNAISNLVSVKDTDGNIIKAESIRKKIANEVFEVKSYRVVDYAVHKLKGAHIRTDIAFIDLDFSKLTKDDLIMIDYPTINLDISQHNSRAKGKELYIHLNKNYPRIFKIIHSFYTSDFDEVNFEYNGIKDDDFTKKLSKMKDSDRFRNIESFMPPILQKQARLKIEKDPEIQNSLKKYSKQPDDRNLIQIENLLIGWVTFVYDKKTGEYFKNWIKAPKEVVDEILDLIENVEPKYTGVSNQLIMLGSQSIKDFLLKPDLYPQEYLNIDNIANEQLNKIILYKKYQTPITGLTQLKEKFNVRDKQNDSYENLKEQIHNLLIYQRIICTLWKMVEKGELEDFNVIEYCRLHFENERNPISSRENGFRYGVSFPKKNYKYPFVYRQIDDFVKKFNSTV